nr:MAG TPA: hypothetical protein [Caudoviricetes sp.]
MIKKTQPRKAAKKYTLIKLTSGYDITSIDQSTSKKTYKN